MLVLLLTQGMPRIAEAEAQVKGFVGAQHKKFGQRHDAEAYLAEGSALGGGSRGGAGHAGADGASPQVAPSTRDRDRQLLAALQSPHPGDKPTRRRVWTDGACPNNGKAGARAGIGVYWGNEGGECVPRVQTATCR